MKFENFIEKVGNTPLVKYGQYNNATIWVKLEGENPTGSLKDRSALAIINKKIETGELTNDKTILDASSGSFACAATYIGYLLGYRATMVANSKLTGNNEKFINYFDGEIIRHGEVTKEGYEYCKNILIKDNPDKYCFLDQLNNWESPRAHYNTTAPEIFKELPDVSAIVASMGSGATLCGISEYVHNNELETKIIASNGKPGKKIAGTFLEGDDYVSPFIQKIRENNWVDYVGKASYEEAKEAVKKMSAKGFFVGIQTGGVFKAALEGVDALNIKGHVVIISGDTGWKNLDRIID